MRRSTGPRRLNDDTATGRHKTSLKAINRNTESDLELADNFSAGAGGQFVEGGSVNVFADESNGAIAQQELSSAIVIAAVVAGRMSGCGTVVNCAIVDERVGGNGLVYRVGGAAKDARRCRQSPSLVGRAVRLGNHPGLDSRANRGNERGAVLPGAELELSSGASFSHGNCVGRSVDEIAEACGQVGVEHADLLTH